MRHPPPPQGFNTCIGRLRPRARRCLALLLASVPGLALAIAAVPPAADVAGSRDHEHLKRYEGALVVAYAQSAFDEFTLPLAVLEEEPGQRDAKNNQRFKPASTKALEGRHTRLVYLLPAQRSTLEVARNYRDEIGLAGGTVLFECAGEACGGDATRSQDGGGGQMSLAMVLKPPGEIAADYGSAGWCAQAAKIADQRYIAAEVPAHAMHVSIHVYRLVAPDQYDVCLALNDRVVAVVDVVDAKAREQKMVTVSASEMAGAIASSGSVALYGILFDFNQAVVKPESEPTLVEIAKYLSDAPSTRILVVGHTDSVGSYAFNLDLSQRRAEAVVDALVSRFAIARQRLTAVGVSFASPVASNRTDEGRAKNRRVAIVEAD